jgi:phi13 family phage major tail protein
MAENKIKYGLKNVHYAIAEIAADGSATYETPVPIPGAVNLSFEPQGDSTPFHADDIVYYTSVANNGYEGDLEIARVPDSFKNDVLGYIESEKHVLVENANAPAVHFALLFQFAGDQRATKHVMYNCTATRAATSSATKAESIEPQTESLTITAATIFVSTLGADGTDIVKSESHEATDSTTYAGWYSAVYIPTGEAQ